MPEKGGTVAEGSLETARDPQLRVRMVSSSSGLRRVGLFPPAAAISACTAASQAKVSRAAGTWGQTCRQCYTGGIKDETLDSNFTVHYIIDVTPVVCFINVFTRALKLSNIKYHWMEKTTYFCCFYKINNQLKWHAIVPQWQCVHRGLFSAVMKTHLVL